MNIGQIIHNRRMELNLTLEEVGKIVGVSKSTVKKWEDGYISNMKRDKIASLSKALYINPVSLITGELILLEEDEKPQMLPVFNSPLDFSQNKKSNTRYPALVKKNSTVEYGWIIISDDSMSPLIDNKSKVLVKKTDRADNNIAVILYDDKVLIRKVTCENDKCVLSSVNPYYPPQTVDLSHIKILGVVLEVVKNLL